ncbi:dynein heavy chain, putative, partial [Hepatocystis sp. ex Piliocolobus tephrosceles]
LKYETSRYFNEEDIKEDGYFIGGLFIEGAVFDVTNLTIKESNNKQLYSPLPFIKISFVNKETSSINTKGSNSKLKLYTFKCPVYKSIHKTDNNLNKNPIFYLKLRSKEKREKWIERNVCSVLILK